MLGMEIWFERSLHSVVWEKKKISPKPSHHCTGCLTCGILQPNSVRAEGTPDISGSGVYQRLFTSLYQMYPEDQSGTSLTSCTLVSIFEDSSISLCMPLIIQSSFTKVWRKSQSIWASLSLCLTHMALSLSHTHTCLSSPMMFPYIAECIILIHLAEDAFEINRGH